MTLGDLNVYRQRIGVFHSRASTVRADRCLDLDTFILAQLVLRHGTCGLLLMIYVQCVVRNGHYYSDIGTGSSVVNSAHRYTCTDCHSHLQHAEFSTMFAIMFFVFIVLSTGVECCAVVSVVGLLCVNMLCNPIATRSIIGHTHTATHTCRVHDRQSPGFSTFASLLLAIAGDIHPNPGPSPGSCSTSVTSTNNTDDTNDPLAGIAPSDLTIMHLNIQSLLPKRDLIEVELAHFDILMFSETWLDQSVTDNDISLPNFRNPFRSDRTRHGGGVAIYVKNCIPATRRRDLEMKGVECAWVEVKIGHRPVLVGVFYRPPNIQNWDIISNSIDSAHNTNIKTIVIGGDFNDNLLNKKLGQMMQIINTYSMTQLIREPTHYTENSSSLIDLMMVSDASKVKLAGVGEPVVSNAVQYHCPVYLVLRLRKPTQPCFKRVIWKYDQGNYQEYRRELSETDWSHLLLENNLDLSCSLLTDTILRIAKNTIPNKLVNIRPRDPPWMHNELRKSIRKRKRLHKSAKKNPQLWANFRSLRNQIIGEIRKAQVQYHKTIASKLQSSHSSPKSWWKLVKQMLNSNNSQSNAYTEPLNHNGTSIFDDKDKAEVFNNYFIEQSTIDDSGVNLPPSQHTPTSILDYIEFSPTEVTDILSSLDPTKASGPDLIHPRLLKEGANQLGLPLSFILNNSIKLGTFPNNLKLANVLPVHKKDEKSVVSNYRPISLLSCVGKVLEKCVFKRLNNYFLDNNLLTPLQSGFRQNDSTVYQLTEVYNTFASALDDGKEIRTVFCDISKAFDKVWHRGLIFKLNQLGITGKLLEWLKDYLSDRKQRVVINSKQSSWKKVKAGVPQGSNLGPLLFLVYINDIVTEIGSTIKLFADDTTLYLVVENPVSAAVTLNTDLDRIHSWAKSWLVTFNPNKTETMIISRKRKQQQHPPLFMNQSELTTVLVHKHLGVFLSNNGSWHEHITYITEKAWKRLGILRHLKFKLDRLSLQKIYFSHIRPLIEYADTIWDNCTLYEKNAIEKINLEAARIVSGATVSASRAILYSETGWDSMSKRREKHKLIQFYKMYHQMTPTYLSQLIPSHRTLDNRPRTRHTADIPPPATRTNLYRDSFLPSTIKAWNELPPTLRQSPSLDTFKRQLNTHNPKIPQYYHIGARQYQILHARLRMGCSNLNYDLHKNFVSDTDKCKCGEIETAAHYFLTCPNYSHIRNTLIHTIPYHLNTDTLLYGNNLYDNETNSLIFSSIHEYIKQTKRFS
jgi:hypothetical protein